MKDIGDTEEVDVDPSGEPWSTARKDDKKGPARHTKLAVSAPPCKFVILELKNITTRLKVRNRKTAVRKLEFIDEVAKKSFDGG